MVNRKLIRRPRGERSSSPRPDLSPPSRAGPGGTPGPVPVWGRAEPKQSQEVLALLGPSSGEARGGSERGRGLSCRGWGGPLEGALTLALPPAGCVTRPLRLLSRPQIRAHLFLFLIHFCLRFQTLAEPSSVQPWTKGGRRGEAQALAQELGRLPLGCLRKPVLSRQWKDPADRWWPRISDLGHSSSELLPSVRVRSTPLYREFLRCGLLGSPQEG